MNGQLTSHTVDLTHWNSTHCILITAGTMNWGTLLPLSSSFYIFQLLFFQILKTSRYDIHWSVLVKHYMYLHVLTAAGSDNGGQKWKANRIPETRDVWRKVLAVKLCMHELTTDIYTLYC